MLNLLPPEAISLEAAAAALLSKDFFVRYTAARLLGRRGDRDARLVLQDVLSDGEPPSRASAARELHGFSWFSVEPSLRQALADPDLRVREAAVYALCDLREHNAFLLLAHALQNEVDDVRSAAAWSLRECRDLDALPVLEVIVTRAGDPDVRVQALESLGANGSPAAIPIVRAALEDIDPDAQYAATLSWLELAGEVCLPELADRIAHASGSSRRSLLRGLFHATNYLQIDLTRSAALETMLNAFEAATRDPAPEVRMAAAWPLAWLVDDRAAALLERAYAIESDDEVKAHYVRVAVGLMSAAGEALFQDALNSERTAVRDAAELIRAAGRVRRVDEELPPGEGPIWKR